MHTCTVSLSRELCAHLRELLKVTSRVRYSCAVESKVTVMLSGGLGNQLFMYYAGAAVAARQGCALEIETTWTRYAYTDHGLWITNFHLPGEWRRRRVHEALLGLPGSVGGISRALLKQLHAKRKPTEVYVSKSLGWDPGVFSVKPGYELSGYFQSWKYVHEATSRGWPLPRLLSPSEDFKTLVTRALHERPTVVHVRRGDYSSLEHFGLLDRSYYARALRVLSDSGNLGPVWVFSDDPILARQVVDGEIINLNPAEDLALMAYGRSHVLANSTFGWWGAWLGGSSGPVIVPHPWFRHGPEIPDLFPPTWLLLEATFE